MRFSSLVSFAIAGASLCMALPTNLTNFLLVTTSQIDPSANTSELKAVSATSLFVYPYANPINHSIFLSNNHPGPIPPTCPPSPPNRPRLWLPTQLYPGRRNTIHHRPSTLQHHRVQTVQQYRCDGWVGATVPCFCTASGQYCLGRGIPSDCGWPKRGLDDLRR